MVRSSTTRREHFKRKELLRKALEKRKTLRVGEYFERFIAKNEIMDIKVPFSSVIEQHPFFESSIIIPRRFKVNNKKDDQSDNIDKIENLQQVANEEKKIITEYEVKIKEADDEQKINKQHLDPLIRLFHIAGSDWVKKHLRLK